MAKSKSRSKSPKGRKKAEIEASKKPSKEQKKPLLTLEALEAISSDEDDEDAGGVVPLFKDWDSKAKQLKKAIEEGAFEHLLQKKGGDDDDDDEDDDEDIEEVTLDSSSDAEDNREDLKNKKAKVSESKKVKDEQSGSDDDDDDKNEEMENEEEAEENDSDEEEDESDHVRNKKIAAAKAQSDDEEEEDEEEDENEMKPVHIPTIAEKNVHSYKALAVVTAQLQSSKSGTPWPETFAIVPPTPLPFGEEHCDPESNPLDIHDDLKREAAFYNTALEAVRLARAKCLSAGIPFSRPDDFFAEMVKTDGKHV
jgi:rRNA-processing protein EBP2